LGVALRRDSLYRARRASSRVLLKLRGLLSNKASKPSPIWLGTDSSNPFRSSAESAANSVQTSVAGTRERKTSGFRARLLHSISRHGAARQLLIEASWTYRFPARLGRELLLRQENQPRAIREIVWKRGPRIAEALKRHDADVVVLSEYRGARRHRGLVQLCMPRLSARNGSGYAATTAAQRGCALVNEALA
jgi:hypothetical protein